MLLAYIAKKKEMKFLNKSWFALIIVIVFASCRAMKEPDYKSIDSFQVKTVSGDTSTLVLNIRYYNPNKRSLKLKDAEGDAYIDSLYLGHFSMIHW